MASSSQRSRPGPGSGVLPMDAFYEILLRLPAKELCRLRAVCRPWRSLLSDPQFITAHAGRHPGPLIVAGYDRSCRDEGILCDILDVTGRVIKRIHSTSYNWVISTHLEFACAAVDWDRSWQLHNLATGDVFPLPEGLSEEYAEWPLDSLNYRAVVALGQVASTGEYKLIRMIDNGFFSNMYQKVCEVFTLDGSGNARWRGKKNSRDPVCMGMSGSRAVVDGIVYFFLDEAVVHQDDSTRGIASFDLLTEEWRATLRGPISNFVDDELVEYDILSLAALNGSLVVVHHNLNAFMDLWFLMDFEGSLWVKQHSIQLNFIAQHDEFLAHPLLMLKDGRIVTYIGSRGFLRIFNPRTNTYTDVAELGPCVGVGLYSGSLLSLPNRAT